MRHTTRQERLAKIDEIFTALGTLNTSAQNNINIEKFSKQILSGILEIGKAAIEKKSTWLTMDYSEDAVKLASTFKIIYTHLCEEAARMHPYELAQQGLKCLQTPEAAQLNETIPQLKTALNATATKLYPAYARSIEDRRLADNQAREKLAARTLTGTLWCTLFNGLSAMTSMGEAHVPNSFLVLGLVMSAYQYASADYRDLSEYMQGFRNVTGPAFNNSGITYCFNTGCKLAEKGAVAIADRVNRHLLDGEEHQQVEGNDHRPKIEELADSPVTQRRIGFS